MNKLAALFFIGSLLFVGDALAHCGKCGVGDAQHDADHAKVNEKVNAMAAELGLSEEQKVKLEAIMLEKKAKKQEAWDEKKAAIESLSDDYYAKVKEVLTPEQFAKWEASKAAKKVEWKDKAEKKAHKHLEHDKK